jgi:hypothetical protein
MRVAICQPTYLPWLGYFDLMDQVDTFVLFDTVQFDKRSWQQRNRIKAPGGLQWLTVPVSSRGRYEQKIHEVEIVDTNFVRTHLRALELNYLPTRHFARFFPVLSSVLGNIEPRSRLADLNIRLLRWLVEILGIRTRIVLASSLQEEGKRTGLLANICRAVGAKEYISPIGSAEYLLADLSIMRDAKVETLFHNYVHPEYEQRFPPFVPFASVVDLIFNEGDRAMEIIRSGRGVPLTGAEVAESIVRVKQA